MASTYSSYKYELITTGEQSGTWGTTTNVNIGTAIQESIGGYATATFPTDANYTLPFLDVSTTQTARNLTLNVASIGALTATRALIVPTIAKMYFIYNNTTGGQSINVKTTAGTGVIVPNGKKALVYADGTNVVPSQTALPVSATLTFTLPTADGTTGQALITNATGGLSFGTAATATLATTATTATTATNLAGGVAGNVPYQTGAGATVFSTQGANGTVLTSNGAGGFTWSAGIPAATAANLSGGAAGKIVYQSALDNTAFSAVGTAGQPLLSGGAGAPTWYSLTGIIKAAAGVLSSAASVTDYIAPSAYASANGLTMNTARLLGRSTAANGAAEEISVVGATLAGGVLTISTPSLVSYQTYFMGQL